MQKWDFYYVYNNDISNFESQFESILNDSQEKIETKPSYFIHSAINTYENYYSIVTKILEYSGLPNSGRML